MPDMSAAAGLCEKSHVNSKDTQQCDLGWVCTRQIPVLRGHQNTSGCSHLQRSGLCTDFVIGEIIQDSLHNNMQPLFFFSLGRWLRWFDVSAEKKSLLSGQRVPPLSSERDHALQCHQQHNEFSPSHPQVAVISWGTVDMCDQGKKSKKKKKNQDGDEVPPPDARDFHIDLFKILPWLKQHLGEQILFLPEIKWEEPTQSAQVNSGINHNNTMQNSTELVWADWSPMLFLLLLLILPHMRRITTNQMAISNV